MIVTVASGKGGTGKTTVSINLALSVAAQGDVRVHVLDCDVEAPNAALFLKPTFEHRENVGIPVPEVDFAKCTYCGRCAEVCEYHTIAVVGHKVLIFPEMCHGCGSCTLNCPERAIREVQHVTGVIEEGRAGPIRFAHGILDVGQPMAVPIIRQLKKRATADGDHVLVVRDASPGTACPVVESLRGADFALLVTEPTPFGLHDLRLAVEVARDELRMPVGVVINREGIGDEGVNDYCEAEGIPILMRIPQDRRIAKAYSDGVPLVEAQPEYKRQFLTLYHRIGQEVRR